MALQEKNSLKKIVQDAERALSEVFSATKVQGRLWFTLFDNSVLSLCVVNDFGAIVFEHAEDIEHILTAEDTDLFYENDYETQEALIADILERAKHG